MIRKLCDRFSIDVIHLHFWNFCDCFAMKLARFKHGDIVTVVHHHNVYHVSDSGFRESIKKWFLKGNAQIACGQAVYENLLESGFPEKYVHKVTNCLFFERLNRYEPLEWAGTNILMFSSYSPYNKGVDIAVKAISLVRESGRKVNLVISVGADLEGVMSFVASSLGDMEEPPEWIQFIKARDDIATYYHAADIFLSASRTEGFCAAVLEAFYCGCEVVQTNIREHSLDVPECLLCRPEDPENLAEIIMAALEENPSVKLERLCKQKEYIEQTYPVDNWVKGCLKVYHTMANRK